MAEETELRNYVVSIPATWLPGQVRHHRVRADNPTLAAWIGLQRSERIEDVAGKTEVVAILDGQTFWDLTWRDHNAKCRQFRFAVGDLRKWGENRPVKAA